MEKYFTLIYILMQIGLFQSEAKAEIFESYPGDISVEALDADINLENLGNSYRKNQNSPPKYDHNGLPPAEEIDLIFKKAGLSKIIKSMDQLERDILYFTIVKHSERYVKEKYPNINSSGIRKAKKIIQESTSK